VQGLQDQANHILGQIQNGINLGQEAINELTQQFHAITEQLQNIGENLAGQVGEIITGVIGTISGIWNNIFGKVANRGIGDFVSNWIQSAFPNLISTIQGWIQNLGMSETLKRLMAMHLPGFVCDWIIENILDASATQKGWFNFENIFGIISGGIGALWTQIADLAQEIFLGAHQQFQSIQDLAQNFLHTMMEEGSTIASHAAQQMLAVLRPYAADLGQLYTQIEAQVNGIVNQISGN